MAVSQCGEYMTRNAPTIARDHRSIALSRDAVHNRLWRWKGRGTPSGRELLSAIVPGAALRWPPAIDSCPFGAFIVPSSNGQTPDTGLPVIGNPDGLNDATPLGLEAERAVSQGRLRQPWARLCNHFVVVPPIKRAVALGKAR